MPAHFGAKLRRLRESHELTQMELARRLGLSSHSHIAKLEAGLARDRPSLNLVVRTAALFGVPVDQLVRDTIATEALETLTLGIVLPVEVDPARLGQQIRTLRQAQGFTQTTLARQLGPAGQSGIGKIERGEKLPSLERLEQLADVLDIAIDELVQPALCFQAHTVSDSSTL